MSCGCGLFVNGGLMFVCSGAELIVCSGSFVVTCGERESWW